VVGKVVREVVLAIWPACMTHEKQRRRVGGGVAGAWCSGRRKMDGVRSLEEAGEVLERGDGGIFVSFGHRSAACLLDE